MKNIKETVSDYIQNVRQSLSTIKVPEQNPIKTPPVPSLKQGSDSQKPEENAITKKYNDYLVSLEDILSITKASEDPYMKSIPIQTRKEIFKDITKLFNDQPKAVKAFALFEQDKVQQRTSYDFKKLFQLRKNYNLSKDKADYIYRVLQTWASDNEIEVKQSVDAKSKQKSNTNPSFDFGVSRAMDESIIKRWKTLADIK